MWKIVTAACLGVLLTACGSGKQAGGVPTVSSAAVSETTVGTTSAAETTAAASLGDSSEPRELDVTLQEVLFDVDPGGVTLDSGIVWVPSREMGELLAVDVGVGALRDTFEIGGEPVAVASAEGALWVTEHEFGDAVVLRVDPDTGEVIAEIASRPGATHPLHVVGGAGAIWTTISGAEVARIDPATNELVKTITASESGHPPGYGALVFGFGSVWVIDYESGRLLRIDPATNTIAATFDELGYDAEDLGDGSMSVHATGPVALATTADGLWVLSDTVNPDQTDVVGYGALYLLDPNSGEITRRVDLTLQPDAIVSPGLVITDGAAWFVEAVNGDIVRVDLATEFEDYVYTGSREPQGLVATNDTLWFPGYGGLFGIDLAEAAGLAQR